MRPIRFLPARKTSKNSNREQRALAHAVEPPLSTLPNTKAETESTLAGASTGLMPAPLPRGLTRSSFEELSWPLYISPTTVRNAKAQLGIRVEKQCGCCRFHAMHQFDFFP